MAGTLTVQNLQGPSSGANANKIIIPSGQTIDASAGTLVPSAGQVVQCVQYYDADTSFDETTSTSLVGSSIRKTITPKHDNSLIIVQSSVSMADGHFSNFMAAKMYLNGTAMVGSNHYHFGYQTAAQTRYTPFVFQAQHPCTSTAALEFRVYFRSGNGGNARLIHAGASAALTLWEIAQ